MQIGIGIAIGIAVGAALALLAVSVFGTTGVSKARRIRDQLLDDARRESDAVRREAQVEAREQAVRLRSEIDTELTDRRGQVARLTDAGFAALEAAAPSHVEQVRRVLFDRLTDEQVLQLAAICNAITSGCEAAGPLTESCLATACDSEDAASIDGEDEELLVPGSSGCLS